MYQLSELLNAIIIGDVRNALKKIPSNSVRSGITSPPYFGLRDYGTAIWIGGDATCDHKKASAATINTSLAKSTLAGGMEGQRISYEQKQTNKHSCNRCGAVRIDNQIGLEKKPEDFIKKLVLIFREFRRILKEDGTLWVNIGDSYWGGKGTSGDANGEKQTIRKKNNQSISHTHSSLGEKGKLNPLQGKHPEIKPKDLVGIPWMLAFALRADGWYLRQDIIWHKPNPMPESVQDRCTKSHEYIFLLSKSPKYYYDSYAIKQPAITGDNGSFFNTGKTAIHQLGRSSDKQRKSGNIERKPGSERGCPEDSGSNVCGSVPWEGDMANKKSVWNNTQDDYHIWDWLFENAPYYVVAPLWEKYIQDKLNKKSVWTVSTKPFSGAHFATFPQTLIQDCIKAGTSEKGQCSNCGKPWQRIIKKENVKNNGTTNTKYDEKSTAGRLAKKRDVARQQQDKEFSNNENSIGWQPTCECNGKFVIEKIKQEQDDPIYGSDEETIIGYEAVYDEIKTYIPNIPLEDHPVSPDVVMDLFGGAGTTHLVANKLGRQSISTELNASYVKDITVPRLQKELGMFNSVKIIEL